MIRTYRIEGAGRRLSFVCLRCEHRVDVAQFQEKSIVLDGQWFPRNIAPRTQAAAAMKDHAEQAHQTFA
jgi:hypothetical protein